MKSSKLKFLIEKKKILNIVLSCVMMFVFFPTLCISDEGPSREIVTIAQASLKQFTANMPFKELQKMGFKNQQEVNNATIGEGFQVYTVYQDVLLNEANQDLHAMSVPNPPGMWRFPVTSSERFIVLLDIGLLNGKWTFLGIGAPGLAHKINGLIKKWPKNKGYNFRFISIQKTLKNYIAITKAKKIKGFIPLSSKERNKGVNDNSFNQQDLKSSAEILTALRANEVKTLN